MNARGLDEHQAPRVVVERVEAPQPGHPMHEAVVETNTFRLQLVFHDLRIERAGDEVSVYDQVTFPLQ